MAYKRELIINNGSLTSYKKLLKVSDVCQLLDKSKYPATQTINGVTFTNNGDGTITVNGTATANVRYGYDFLPNWDSGGGLDVISTFLYIGCPAGGSNSTYGIYNGWMTDNYQDVGAGAFTHTTPDKYNGFYRFSYNIGIRKGYTANNLVFKPQLFDLTEMYGAGNEPATVEEFKAKFPNEMYDYSPRCWVKSYKTGLIAKTKNLFDVNNAVPYTFSTDNPDGNLLWLKDGIYTTRINNYVLGSGLRIKNGLSLPAGTYTVSAKIVDFYNIDIFNIGFSYKDTESKWHNVNGFSFPNRVGVGDTVAFEYNIPEHTDLRLYLNYQNNNGEYLTGFVSYKDIQVEQGSTATDYVPYGYL